MSSKRQSSVEWLAKQIIDADKNGYSIQVSKLNEWIAQAKQLHEQEIIDAWDKSAEYWIKVYNDDDYGSDFKTKTANEYYKDTYGKE